MPDVYAPNDPREAWGNIRHALAEYEGELKRIQTERAADGLFRSEESLRNRMLRIFLSQYVYLSDADHMAKAAAVMTCIRLMLDLNPEDDLEQQRLRATVIGYAVTFAPNL